MSQPQIFLVLEGMELKHLKLMIIMGILLISAKALAEEVLSPADFVNRALKHNLDLRLVDAETKEITAEASGIRLPPPSVSVTQMNMANGGTAQGWQVSQTIPFPSKISRDYSARQHALHARKDEELSEKLTIMAQAKLIYFLVWEAQEQKSILEEKRKLLKKHISIARSMARSDTFAKIHLLKAESEKDRVEISLENNSQVHQERLSMAAQLVDNDPKNFRFKAIEPPMRKLPNISSIENVPQIQAMKMHLKHYESLEKAARTEWLPDFTISYGRMEETLRFPENNQIMVGLTLPFAYFWQPRAKSSQGHAQRLETEIKLKKKIRQIQAEKINLEEALRSLKAQIKTLEQKILPRAIQRKRLFQNISPRNLSSLQEHLDTYLSIPDTRLQILTLKTQYEQAVSWLAQYQAEKVNDAK